MNTSCKWLLTVLCSLALSGCESEDPNRIVGTLERDRIELKTESDEPIIAIHVRDSESVAQGTVIIQQDTRRHQARLDQHTAVHAQANARLAELQRGPRQEAIREAQARLEASEVLTRNAEAEYERAQTVFDRGLSFESDLDRARTLWEAEKARELASREALQSLLSGTTVEELQQAQAVVDAAAARVREAEISLERLSISAPSAGMVDKVLFEPGERPAPGSTVAVLLDDSRAFARVYIPEHLKASATVGSRIDVLLDGVSQAVSGTVEWVSADAVFTPYFALTQHDRSRLSFLAEITLDNVDDLPVGLPLEARIPGADD